MCVWICVSSRTPDEASRNASTAQLEIRRPIGRRRSGSPSRIAGSSIWMIWMPAASRSITSSRMASAICRHVSRAGLIVANERPLKNRDRPGEHSFDRLVGERLRVLRPVDGHRVWAFDVAKNDRRFDTSRSVALNPTVLGEREPGQLFAEIFDHVVALGLAMNEHVEA